MDLNDLLLKKEELPLITIEGTLSCPNFCIPIHPKLLDPNVKLDERLANNVFPKAAQEWYKDLSKVAQNDKWIKDVFLKKYSIKNNHDEQTVTSVGWHDHVLTLENGFASSLCISRNHGGMLYLDPNKREGYIHRHNAKFSLEKFRAYSCEKNKSVSPSGTTAYVYSGHNIDHYSGALFLRNWAILYLNEALKQIANKL